MRAIARLRLAAVQADAKQFPEALKTLDAISVEGFEGLVADRRGDILNAQGKTAEARAAWQAAYKAMDDKLDYRKLVESKLTAIGAAPDMPATARRARHCNGCCFCRCRHGGRIGGLEVTLSRTAGLLLAGLAALLGFSACTSDKPKPTALGNLHAEDRRQRRLARQHRQHQVPADPNAARRRALRRIGQQRHGAAGTEWRRGLARRCRRRRGRGRGQRRALHQRGDARQRGRHLRRRQGSLAQARADGGGDAAAGSRRTCLRDGRRPWRSCLRCGRRPPAVGLQQARRRADAGRGQRGHGLPQQPAGGAGPAADGAGSAEGHGAVGSGHGVAARHQRSGTAGRPDRPGRAAGRPHLRTRLPGRSGLRRRVARRAAVDAQRRRPECRRRRPRTRLRR